MSGKLMSIQEARTLLSDLSNEDVAQLVGVGIDRLRQVAVESDDPEVLLNESMRHLFSSEGGMAPPTMVAEGVVAIPSFVKRTTGDRHKCSNATVLIGEKETWAWDEHAETYVNSGITSVGSNQRSIALHVAVPGLRIIRHVMNWDGQRHERLSTECFVIGLEEKENGEAEYTIAVDPDYVSSRLPLPGAR